MRPDLIFKFNYKQFGFVGKERFHLAPTCPIALFTLIKGEIGTDFAHSIANLANILTLLFPIQLFDLKQKETLKNKCRKKRAEINWHLLVFY